MSTLSFLKIGITRWITHASLAGITAGSLHLAHLYAPFGDLNYRLTIACGYLSLTLIVISLLIGPYKLLWRRRNPVNIDLRRDVGIWAGMTGIVHVVCGFQLHKGGQIIYYFLEPGPLGLHLLKTPFGYTNDLGLIAVILLGLLLAISNDVSLRQLKGKRWKKWQRLNYVLIVLVLLHTVIYQTISQRERPFIFLTFVLSVLLLVGQGIGFLMYRSNLQPKNGARRILRLLS